MKRKVYWNTLEKDAIYNKMVVLFSSKPHLTNKKARHLAQTVLPRDRWRNITNPVVFKNKSFIESARNFAGAHKAAEQTITAPAPSISKQDSMDAVLDQMANSMAEKILKRVQDKLSDALQGSSGTFNFSTGKFGD